MKSSWSPWMQGALFAGALVAGAAVTYMDSRPTWDDTGVTAAALFVMAGVFGFFGQSRPWLWALALGAWIPLMAVVRTRNYASMLALAFTLAGAYAGAALRRQLSPAEQRR